MNIVASITDSSQAASAVEQGADMIEIRLDLIESDGARQAASCRKAVSVPIIATLRSAHEGGRYFGDSKEWYKRIQQVVPFSDYIDVEQRFAIHAAPLRTGGKKIIASFHADQMVSLSGLFELERELRAFGDIPKIIVTPQNVDDVIDLISFTQAANKPICTGVMGARFRFTRLILPFFGSVFVYCHAGIPTADGQYSVAEAKAAMALFGAQEPG